MEVKKIKDVYMYDVKGQCDEDSTDPCCWDCADWKNNTPPKISGCTETVSPEIVPWW